jgi:hypothetical protein
MAENTLWRVKYSGKHLGTVAALDGRGAIAQAAKQFHITPVRQDRISVVELDDRRTRRDDNERN